MSGASRVAAASPPGGLRKAKRANESLSAPRRRLPVRFGSRVREARFRVAHPPRVDDLSSCVYYNTFYLAKKNLLPQPRRRAVSRRQDRHHPATAVREVDRVLEEGRPELSQIEVGRRRVSPPGARRVDRRTTIPGRRSRCSRSSRPSSRRAGCATRRSSTSASRYRQARKNERAIATLDAYLADKPKSDLARIRELRARGRSRRSIARRTPRTRRARRSIASKEGHAAGPGAARCARTRCSSRRHSTGPAPTTAHWARAATDDDRLTFLLRESECIEGARELRRRAAAAA